ncbi:MAG: hypothetical protein ACUVX8_13075, partial [Candidatus Zipacnadales bacterium]
MRFLTSGPASAEERHLVVSFVNGPFGRALIGIVLGVLVFACQQAGWFHHADLCLLDQAGVLTRSPWERGPVVLVATPTQVPGVDVRAQALANVLDAGAAAVGFDSLYLA